ncbi:hypothetical protein ACFFGH_10940 [Lysobacter korlensis]|uniref:DUF1648 domain-containing protein n=1 Tax=Lysobacter korlensis TaxID=553636 RepID=A0ABV6RMZ7_9GAMM
MSARRLPLLTGRMLLVAAVVPVLVTLSGVAIMLAWLPDVPASVAVHWGSDATPDGFVPAWAAPVLLAVVGIAVPLTLAGALTLSPAAGRVTARHKFVAVTSLWAAVFLTIVLTWIFGAQRGMADAAQAPGPLWPLLAGFAIAFVIAAAAWSILPPAAEAPSEAARTPNALPLAAGERAIWTRRGTASGYLVLSAAVVLLLVGMAITVGAVTDGRLWGLALLPLVLFALFATTAAWHVRIDSRGVVARGILGLPRFHIPLSDIRTATVVSVEPLADFGGWGFRWGSGRRFGIVLRAGEALELERLDGRSFVITTDDAERAAALVNGMRARATLGS